MRMDSDTALRIGHRVIHLEQVTSTQERAWQEIDHPRAAGTVIRADVQTHGRGRHGRLWLSPSGQCLMFSVILKPPAALDRPVVLTLLGAVAICEAVFIRTQLQTTIKWPNDIFIRGRKIAGLLVERSPRGTVIGMGLNVSIPAAYFDEHALHQAGSLAMFTEQPVDADALFTQLLQSINDTYADVVQGNVADLEARWRFHSALLGRAVVVQTMQQSWQGRLVELSLQEVVLQLADGSIQRLAPEAILQMQAESSVA